MSEISHTIDFDKQSAWLRRFQADIESNLDAFSKRLKEAMPEQVELLETKPFLFGSPKLTGVRIELGENCFTLENARGKLKATKQMIVHGITLNTKQLDAAAWFAELVKETQKTVEHAKCLSQSLSAFMAT